MPPGAELGHHACSVTTPVEGVNLPTSSAENSVNAIASSLPAKVSPAAVCPDGIGVSAGIVFVASKWPMAPRPASVQYGLSCESTATWFGWAPDGSDHANQALPAGSYSVTWSESNSV